MHRGFPGGSGGKASACNAGDLGWIPGSGRSPGEGNDNPLQYSCLENSMDRGAWCKAMGLQRVRQHFHFSCLKALAVFVDNLVCFQQVGGAVLKVMSTWYLVLFSIKR